MRNSSKSKRCRQPPVDVVAMNNGTGDRLSTKHHRNNRNGGESCDIVYNSSVRLRREDRSLIRDIVAGGMTSMFKGCLIFCSAMFAYSVLSNFNNKNFIHQVRRSTSRSRYQYCSEVAYPFWFRSGAKAWFKSESWGWRMFMAGNMHPSVR